MPDKTKLTKGSKPVAFLPERDPDVETMFQQKGFLTSSEIADAWFADVIVYTGGADVSPFLYGEKAIASTSCRVHRDLNEIKLFKHINLTTPKIGICRGAQFLNVMSGGELWQDVDGHCQTHEMYDNIEYSDNEKPITVTSTHHQMMIPSSLGYVLSHSKQATHRECDDGKYKVTDNSLDPEVVYYPHTRSLCVQYHPEYASATRECSQHFWDKVAQVFEGDL